jgi:cytochrome c oxidase subunit 2
MFISFFYKVNCDAAEKWQVNIQDPATPMLEGMQFFYNELMFYMVSIGVAVVIMLGIIIHSFSEKNHKTPINFSHASLLEIVWTIIPAIILFFLSIPSFTLLYSLDDLIDPSITIKIIGHQWYWSYEYSDFFASGIENLEFDSYMLNINDMVKGTFRLLEVDNRVLLPINTHIRLLVTAADVLHSWAVPSFGIKVDACPGRLSQASLFIKREGVYYGQCSEICGVNHGFMPIVVKGVSMNNWINWIIFKLTYTNNIE